MNTEKFHNNGLRYYCDQNINDFQKSESGLFCTMCNKNIIDFRNKSKSEYDDIVKNNKDACGIFYSVQIGDEIEIELNWRKPLMVLSFYFTFLFSRSVNAQSVKETKTELADSTHSNKIDSIATTSNCDSHSKKESSNSVSQNKMKSYRRNRKRLYLSGRFPFIHYDRYRYHVMGSPADFW